MDPALEIAVAGQDGGDHELVVLDGPRNRLVERTGVPDARRAAVAGEGEPERLERRHQPRRGQVAGDGLRARGERGLHGGSDGEAKRDRVAGKQARPDHHGEIEGVVGRVVRAHDIAGVGVSVRDRDRRQFRAARDPRRPEEERQVHHAVDDDLPPPPPRLVRRHLRARIPRLDESPRPVETPGQRRRRAQAQLPRLRIAGQFVIGHRGEGEEEAEVMIVAIQPRHARGEVRALGARRREERLVARLVPGEPQLPIPETVDPVVLAATDIRQPARHPDRRPLRPHPRNRAPDRRERRSERLVVVRGVGRGTVRQSILPRIARPASTAYAERCWTPRSYAGSLRCPNMVIVTTATDDSPRSMRPRRDESARAIRTVREQSFG